MNRVQARSFSFPALAAGLSVVSLAGLALLNRRQSRAAERRSPAKGRFVEVNGVRLHYLDRGAGPPIVMLHGNGAMAADFEASGLIDRLTPSFRVLAFDRPGFGYSARPRGRSWSARQQARLIGDALQQLAIARPIVVGHSWGTLVALELALERPQSVTALVLLSGYYFASLRSDVAMALPQAAPVLGDILDHTIAPVLGRLAAPRIVRKIFAPSSVPARFVAGFPLDLALRPAQLRSTARDTIRLLPAAIATMARRRTLAAPLTLLAGGGDQIVNTDEQSQRLAQELDAPLTVIAGAGHMIHYDAPDQIVTAIDSVAAAMRLDPANTAVALRRLAACKAVIFDIDGTLVDSVDLHAQAWQEAFRHFGHAIDYEAIRGQIGKGGDQLMPVFLSEAQFRAEGAALEKHRAWLFKTKYFPRVVAFAGVRELFERLRRDGKQLVLASSAKTDEIGTYKRIAGITDLVSNEVSADDVSKSKPHPDIFESVLTKLEGITAAEAVVVGDSPYDAEAARKAGLQTIGVLCGGFPEPDLRQAGCIGIFGGAADLLRRYDGSCQNPSY